MLAQARIATFLQALGARSIVVYLAFFLPMALSRVALVRLGLIEDGGLVSLIVTATAIVVPLAVYAWTRETRLRFLFERPALFRLPPRDRRAAASPDAIQRRRAGDARRSAAIGGFFRGLRIPIGRIGLEAGPLSQWLHAGLTAAGFETVLLETRHVKAALSAMTVKTDRRDARGIAQLIRMGWFRSVHCKSTGSQEVRALLVARKQLLGKLLDVEFSIRGILRGFGLKMGVVTRKNFDARARELCVGQAMLEQIAEAMLAARATLQKEYSRSA